MIVIYGQLWAHLPACNTNECVTLGVNLIHMQDLIILLMFQMDHKDCS